MIDNDAEPFERPILTRSAPHRSAGNFYRSASSGDRAIGGLPLDSVEAAVTAAVRMGYKVAAAQIDRTARFARRIKAAGDEAAGPDSDRQALDATEQLVFNAMMSGLSFFEGVAADSTNPIRRLAAAEFRLLGSVLGLNTERTARRADEDTAADDSSSREAGAAAGSSPRTLAHYAPLQVRHEGEAASRRAVQVRRWELTAGEPANNLPLVFHRVPGGAASLEATLTVLPRQPAVLTLRWVRRPASGTWRAPICNDAGLQVGFVEIEL
jgi:hypothetical protein